MFGTFYLHQNFRCDSNLCLLFSKHMFSLFLRHPKRNVLDPNNKKCLSVGNFGILPVIIAIPEENILQKRTKLVSGNINLHQTFAEY